MLIFAVASPTVNEIGYVHDFKDLKGIVAPYDHSVMLYEKDPLCEILEGAGQKVCRLPVNPTCENLAILIKAQVLQLIDPKLLDGVSITVWENDVSYAVDSWRAQDGAP